MNEFIQWCNTNNGFLTAILSLIGLILSAIAIVVSIRTARLPYKKGIKLGASYNIGVSQSTLTSQISTQTIGMSITAVNVGKRDINITFLGLAVKDKSLGKTIKKMEGVTFAVGGTGLLHPTELSEAQYGASNLIGALSRIPRAKVFLYAKDSEGKEYRRHLWRAQDIIDHLKT